MRNELIELVDSGRFAEAHALLAAFPSAYRVGAAQEPFSELERELTLAARDASQPAMD